MAGDPNQFEMFNRLLDEELAEAEHAALQEVLKEDAAAARQLAYMQRLDRLLRATPLASPSSDFTRRVMGAIAELELPEQIRRRMGIGIALGLAIAAILTVPVLSALLIIIARTVLDPQSLAALLGTLSGAASTLWGLGGSLADALNQVVFETPVVPALMTTAIPIGMVWAWLVWYLLGWPELLANRQRL